MQLPCTGDPPHSASTDYGSRTDACMQSDSIQNRLLQCCAPRRSIRHRPQSAASTEQRRKDRLWSTKTITRISTAEETTLVVGGVAHLLQAGFADVQNMINVSTGVPQSTHHSTQWNLVTEIIKCSIAPCALQTDRHRQTIVQLCCTDNLELSACFLSLTVTLSLYLNLGLKLTYLILHTASWPALPVPLKLRHYTNVLLRTKAAMLSARLSHRNSVCPSVCHTGGSGKNGPS